MAENQAVESSLSIPMLDLAPLHAWLAAELDNAMRRVVDSNRYILGDAVAKFERNAARYLGVRHAVGVASGTDALRLALQCAGIGKGDEVITTPFSFWATAGAIHAVGAHAVYVDIASDDMNIDPRHVEAAITSRTRAILPVHIFGHAADMDALTHIAQQYNLVIIEDCAQAFATRYRGRAVGSFGLAGCFSFHPTKPLGAMGDGGLVTSNDDAFAEQLRLLRNHGSRQQHQHVVHGCNSRLDSLQAAILDVKLRHFDTILAERQRLAGRYNEMLAPLDIDIPQMKPEQHCNWAQYTVRCDNRDHLATILARDGIATAVHYPLPLYRQAAYQRHYANLALPVVETTCKRCLSLPLYYGLEDEALERIGRAISRALRDQGS